jgi:hypothetical protein
LFVCKEDFSNQSGLGFGKVRGFLVQISDKENWAALEKEQPKKYKQLLSGKGAIKKGPGGTWLVEGRFHHCFTGI